jgi:hypothetical protein
VKEEEIFMTLTRRGDILWLVRLSINNRKLLDGEADRFFIGELGVILQRLLKIIKSYQKFGVQRPSLL